MSTSIQPLIMVIYPEIMVLDSTLIINIFKHL